MRGMHRWIRGAGLAAAYGVSFYLLRCFAPLTLNLPIGLRLAALLFLPFRMWPWLILGEWCATSTWTITAVLDHGYTLAWLVSGTFLPVFGGLVPATILRRWHSDIDFSSPMYMSSFLGDAAVGATTSAMISTGLAGIAGKAVGMPLPDLLLMYLTGAFAGILCVVPLLAVARQWLVQGTPPNCSIAVQQCLAATGYVTIGALALHSVPAEYLTLGRALLFAPTVFITLLRGWKGAAVVGAVCSIALQTTQRMDLEPSLVAAQDVASVAMGGIMLFGSLLTYHRAIALVARSREQELAAMVRRHTTRAEAQFRHSAGVVDEIYRLMQETEARFSDTAQRADMALQWWSTVGAMRRDLRKLREMFHPRILEEHGLRAAIASGPIQDVLENCNVAYDLVLEGRPGLLSEELQMSLYRLSYESVCLVLRSGIPDRIRVVLRVGAPQDYKLQASLTVTGIVDDDNAWRPGVAVMSTGLSVDSIRLVAESFRGEVTPSQDGRELSMTLFDGAGRSIWDGALGQNAAPQNGRGDHPRDVLNY